METDCKKKADDNKRSPAAQKRTDDERDRLGRLQIAFDCFVALLVYSTLQVSLVTRVSPGDSKHAPVSCDDYNQR